MTIQQPKHPKFKEPEILVPMRVSDVYYYHHLLKTQFEKDEARYDFLKANEEALLARRSELEEELQECSEQWIMDEICPDVRGELEHLTDKLFHIKFKLQIWEEAIEAHKKFVILDQQ